MTLQDPVLERRLRREVRARCQRSPRLREQRRRARQRRLFAGPLWGHALRVGALVALLLGVMDPQTPQAVLLALSSLWAVGLAFALATRLLHGLYASPDLHALQGLPVAPRTVFLWLWQRFARHTPWYAADCLACSWLVTWPASNPPGWTWILAAALWQWVLCVLVAVILALRFPSRHYAKAQTLGLLALFAILIGHDALMPWIQEGLTVMSGPLTRVSPTGWPGQLLTPPADRLPLWAQIVTGALSVCMIALARYAWLHARIGFVAALAHTTPPELASTDDDEPTAASPGELADLRDSIRAGALTEPAFATPPHHWEQWFLGRLGPRERLLMEWMHESPPGWTKQLQTTAMLLTAGLALWPVLALIWPAYRGLAWGYFSLAGAVTLLTGGLALDAPNRPFAPLFMSGVFVPFHAGFPVTFQEISRLCLRMARLRLLAATPVFLVFGLLAGHWADQPPGLALALTGKVLWAAFCLQPILMASRFSSVTNDTARSTLGMLLLLLFAVPLFLLTLALGIILFAGPAAYAWTAAVCLPLPTHLFLRLYRALHDRMHFDLLSTTHPQSAVPE